MEMSNNVCLSGVNRFWSATRQRTTVAIIIDSEWFSAGEKGSGSAEEGGGKKGQKRGVANDMID